MLKATLLQLIFNIIIEIKIALSLLYCCFISIFIQLYNCISIIYVGFTSCVAIISSPKGRI